MTIVAGTAWAEEMLRTLKAPVTRHNVLALELWAESEGVKAYANNPLATTLRKPGSRNYNSAGVQIYAKPEDGGVAAAETLLHGAPAYNYGPVIKAFRTQDTYLNMWVAIHNSSWCKGCQGGNYPAALKFHAGGGSTPGTGNVAGPPAPSPAPPSHSVAEKDLDYSPVIRDASSKLSTHAARAMNAVRATRQALSSRLPG